MSSLANGYVDFVNSSPSPFHAVETMRERLDKSGYVQLSENSKWDLQPNGKYYFTRNQSSILAFAVGGKYEHGNGFNIIGAHTDSPCLKVKPVSNKQSNGYLQVGVQTYGGGIWHSWFDRDLGLAGRVITKRSGAGLAHELVMVNRPILKIPTLAIHLDRTVNESFKFNSESQLLPVLATCIKGELNKTQASEAATEKEAHHPLLLSILSEELKCSADEIVDFELCLFDVQSAAVGGACNEFIFAPRIDNLMSCFCGLEGLTNATQESLQKETRIWMLACFDNEEVGSTSNHGANSTLMEHTVRRITSGFAEQEGLHSTAYERALRDSFLVSADCSHAVHPNYADKHEVNHKPMMNKGPVIKLNANQRYSTTAVTATLIRELAKANNIPTQEFVVKNDSPCGSTIGPMLSAKGFRAMDIGNPQWSMHSIRETCGVDDTVHSCKLFQYFYEQFTSLDKSLKVDF